MEIVTLIVPGFNDSKEELSDIARFIVSVSSDIPWHVTAFHQDYKMVVPNNTSAQSLLLAREIGLQQGLRYVYAGNRPGEVGGTENTFCPNCGDTLIERLGFRVTNNRLNNGSCPKCQAMIPGRWDPS
jgi:pyruvate formate lyase activating enzyme